MADLVIEHDPDSGCAGCLFRRVTFLGYHNPEEHLCEASEHPSAPYIDGKSVQQKGPAGPACPLRTGRVVVQRPGAERPDLSPALSLLADVARGGWEDADGRPTPPEAARAALVVLRTTEEGSALVDELLSAHMKGLAVRKPLEDEQ